MSSGITTAGSLDVAVGANADGARANGVGAASNPDSLASLLEVPVREVLTFDTVALDMNADVSDNEKLVRAITQNVSTMLEQLSIQVSELAQLRAKADVSMRTQLEKGFGAQQDVAERCLGTDQAITEAIEKLNDAFQGNMQAMEQRLQSLERSSDEVSGVLSDNLQKLDRGLEVRIAEIQEGVQMSCMSSMECLQKTLDDSTAGIHAKLDSHIKQHDDLAIEHSERLFKSINQLTLPTEDNRLLKAIENVEEAGLNQMLEAVERLHRQFESSDTKIDEIFNLVAEGMPATGAIAEKVDDLLAEHTKRVDDSLSGHVSSHSDRIVASIGELAAPPSEQSLLQAIQNMHEAALSQTMSSFDQVMEALDKLKEQIPSQVNSDLSTVTSAIDNLQMTVRVGSHVSAPSESPMATTEWQRSFSRAEGDDDSTRKLPVTQHQTRLDTLKAKFNQSDRSSDSQVNTRLNRSSSTPSVSATPRLNRSPSMSSVSTARYSFNAKRFSSDSKDAVGSLFAKRSSSDSKDAAGSPSDVATSRHSRLFNKDISLRANPR